MSEIVPNPDKKKRKCPSKTKAGCITCKLVSSLRTFAVPASLLSDCTHRIRHVKCDEEKPACSRCLKSGRQCDGYSFDGRRPDHDPLQIVHCQPRALAAHPISVEIAGSRKERRAFYFFRDNSAASFRGFSESSFWDQLVLQASHTEPGIRHAVIALGALHENVQLKEGTVLKSEIPSDSFALQQCNMAIGHLKRDISSSGLHSKQMLLMSCILFICFEALQSNYESALSHMQAGLWVFRDWQVEVSKPSPPKMLGSSQHHQSVDSEITKVFSRLNMQPLLFPDTHLFSMDFLRQDVCPIVISVPSAFKTLKEARDCLDSCMSYELQASVAASYISQRSKYETSASQPQNATKERLLSQWAAAFDALVEKASPNPKLQDCQGAELLQIQYNSAKILLSMGMPPQETAFDGFTASFEAIVSLATSIIQRSQMCENYERTCHFSFETGLVPPLYFTATRCRHHRIRHQALSLLASTPRRECLWNSEMLSMIAERIILIEEGRDQMNEETTSEAAPVTSRLSVLNVTMYSKKRQVRLECCQQKCGPDEEICFLDEWIKY